MPNPALYKDTQKHRTTTPREAKKIVDEGGIRTHAVLPTSRILLNLEAHASVT
jgi:hypothetical protein